jgi:deoxyribonuclease-4
VGAHVSVAGGLLRALPRAQAIGAEAIQIFLSSPRAWAPPPPDPDGDEAFRSSCPVPVFVHAPYLINFGSPSAATLAKSSDALAFSLRRARAVGARGVVMHAGSAVLGNAWDAAMAQVREHVLPLLDDVLADGPPADGAPADGALPHGAGQTRLLIEPTAGGGGALASDAASLAAYLDVLGRDERVGVCLDTCHMHAAGHDMSSADGFATSVRRFAKAAGRRAIGLVHVNDSRDPAGSKRDRHEAIGRGTIGREPFAALFTSAALRGVPFVVETADDDHASDIATLKALRDDPARPGRAS